MKINNIKKAENVETLRESERERAVFNIREKTGEDKSTLIKYIQNADYC